MMNDFSHLDSTMLATLVIIVVIAAAIGLTIAIFYFLNLQNTLKQCAPQNRKMEPAMVWLALIPLFNYYWHFRIAADIADSLAAEYRMRGLPLTEERPGYNVGMAYAILSCCGILSWVGVPVLPQLAGLAAFICWIIYWVRMAGYKRELSQHQFQFGQQNPNVYQFPNQFPNQPAPPTQPYQQPGPPNQFPDNPNQ